MSRKIPAVTYTSDEMLEIMTQFAEHINQTYHLHSKLLQMPVVMSPEGLIAVWQNSMEITVQHTPT
jgi:hypothetical protein